MTEAELQELAEYEAWLEALRDVKRQQEDEENDKNNTMPDA